jgi:hypothetical protein
MKAAVARRRPRAPMEISAGNFLVVVCAALALFVRFTQAGEGPVRVKLSLPG